MAKMVYVGTLLKKKKNKHKFYAFSPCMPK